MKSRKWGVVLSAFLLILAACGPDRLDEPLANIQGRWTTTDDPQYADRAFEIDNEFLYLLKGGVTFSVHKIHEVLITEDDLPHYTLEYRGDEGALFSFNFLLSQEDGGTLFFPQQMHMKWNRDPEAPVPWALLLEAERERDAKLSSDP